jgi:hypothetical protein
MASYININGNNIPIRASDPANPIIGEVWYNSTTNALKGQTATAVGSWATGGTMNTGRAQVSGLGTLTAGLAAGTQSPEPNQVLTEEYNGTAWSVGGNLNNGRADLNTFGIQTAGIAAAGDDFPAAPRGTTAAEEYNGTAWTSINPTVGGSYEGGGAAAMGTQTSGLFVGGRTAPPAALTNASQEYDGTSFSSGTNYPSNVQGSMLFGASLTAAISAGGYNGTAVLNSAFSYDGSTWTSINAPTNSRYVGVGAGTNTVGLIFGGAGGVPDTRTQTETFDGTCFAADTNMATPRNSFAGGKVSGTSTFAAGGAPGATEEWTAAGSPQTVTISFT